MILTAETIAATGEALRGGQVVVLPDDVFDESPRHAFGPVAGLERRLHQVSCAGRVVVVHVPLVNRVVAFAPAAVSRTGHDAGALLDELGRINTLYRWPGAGEDLLDRVVPRGPIHVLALQERAVA